MANQNQLLLIEVVVVIQNQSNVQVLFKIKLCLWVLFPNFIIFDFAIKN